jgi:glycosyltransferase involved in cell wall biosynthesis
MKVMFVVPYPRGEAPSQRFRFEQQLDRLEASGVKFDLQSFWDEAAWRVMYKQGRLMQKVAGFMRGWLRRLGLLFRLHRYDVVFLHREAAPVGPPVIEWLMAKVWRKKIIYDYDDAIWLPNVSTHNRFASRLKWYGKVKHICRWSWKVSCGNDYLAAFARRFNDNVGVVPTTVDTDYYKRDFTKPSQRIVIGWTGSLSTNHYLNELDAVFVALAQDVDFDLVIISNHPPTIKHPFVFIPWQRNTEVQDLAQIDIGLMPLHDDEWAKGKCGFKLIQYGALGIPSVASPVGVNPSVVLNGQTGLLATTPDEWLNSLKQLCTDAGLRKRLGDNARIRIDTLYSRRAVASLYDALLTN